jgi:chromosome partitioning protein
MKKIVTEKPISEGEGILHNPEGVNLLPANIELSGMEVGLVNTISRETVLREYIQSVRKNYDYVFIDCSPSLGMLTINAMAAADSLIIPLQPQYLSAKGLEQLLGTVRRVKRQINPKLRIEGILLTMVDSRTKDAREIADLVREAYGKSIKVFATEIPRSVRMSETSKAGKSIFAYDGKCKAAEAYRNLTREVLDNAEKRRKHQLEELR